MDTVGELFDRMDSWRHFPNYQLERRSDLIFALYLRHVLQQKTGIELLDQIVPEFPVRIGAIDPGASDDRSYKIDYIAISRDGKHAFLVELKTESRSRRKSQDRYLAASQKAGMNSLLVGLIQIFMATDAKRKYLCLMKELEAMGQLRIPREVLEIAEGSSLRGITIAAKGITAISKAKSVRTIYIQPNEDGPDMVSFDEFADVIEQMNDPIATRFARSLREWARIEAGQRSFT